MYKFRLSILKLYSDLKSYIMTKKKKKKNFKLNMCRKFSVSDKRKCLKHLVNLANKYKCISIVWPSLLSALDKFNKWKSQKRSWGPLLTLNWYIQADCIQYLTYIQWDRSLTVEKIVPIFRSHSPPHRTIFFYSVTYIQQNINIDGIQPTCIVQWRVSRGPCDLLLVELV